MIRLAANQDDALFWGASTPVQSLCPFRPESTTGLLGANDDEDESEDDEDHDDLPARTHNKKNHHGSVLLHQQLMEEK